MAIPVMRQAAIRQMFFAVFVFSLFFGTVVYPVFDELKSNRVCHHDFRVVVLPVFAHLCGKRFIKNAVCSVARRDTVVTFHQFGWHILHACIALAFVQVERCRPGASAVAVGTLFVEDLFLYAGKHAGVERACVDANRVVRVGRVDGEERDDAAAHTVDHADLQGLHIVGDARERDMLFVISAYGLLSEKPAMEIE